MKSISISFQYRIIASHRVYYIILNCIVLYCIVIRNIVFSVSVGGDVSYLVLRLDPSKTRRFDGIRLFRILCTCTWRGYKGMNSTRHYSYVFFIPFIFAQLLLFLYLYFVFLFVFYYVIYLILVYFDRSTLHC